MHQRRHQPRRKLKRENAEAEDGPGGMTDARTKVEDTQ